VPSATEAAIAALERLALDELAPGELMPSEAALAASLRVSRLTVREATRALAARGLLDLRKGRRPRVLEPTGTQIGDFFRAWLRRDERALLELLEIRRALEVHVAQAAALRASPPALRAMRQAVAQMADGSEPLDEEALVAGDARFHEALAAATGNTMLRQLVAQLAEPLEHGRRLACGGRASSSHFSGVVDAHRRILAAVEDGDAASAAAAMRRHLREDERDLRTALRLPRD
jgi:GntR family transcriptional regulator, transcriptional repressor for pyruvate dehydrogenase complex